MLIKICGIKDPEMALFTAQAGADFIGIMQYPKSKRYVSSELGREIALAAKEGGARPVAVFVDASVEEIIDSCEKIGITMVQTYGKNILLPTILDRIYTNSPDVYLREDRDLLLFDYSEGTGIAFDWDAFKPPIGRNWILGGGLNPQNVSRAIKKLSPMGVDVSTGVEVNGMKDKELIQEFIKQVRLT